jgi:integrase
MEQQREARHPSEEPPRDPLGHARAHRTRLGAVPHPETFVFVGAGDVPSDASTLWRSHMKQILARAGLPPEIRIHDLRHGSASVLADAGAPPSVLKDRLGHHSTSTAARRPSGRQLRRWRACCPALDHPQSVDR